MRRSFFPLFLGLLLAVLQGCATPLTNFDAPAVDLVGLKPLTSRGMEARFAVKLRVLNPNTLPLNVDGLHYQVYLRDERVLSGVSAEPVRIPGYGEGVVDLEASAGVLGSLALLRDLMSNPPDSGLPYRLEVKLSVDRSPRPLRIQREGMLRLSGS